MKTTMPHDHNRALFESIIPSMRYDGKEQFGEWQSKARVQLEKLLGLPFALCDVQFIIEFTKEFDTFTETRFTIQTEAGYIVPCHLWVPKGATGPMPVAICLQGHSKGMHISLGRPKFPGDAESIGGGDRDFAVRIIKEGYCALAIEQRGFGERGGTPEGPDCFDSSMTALLVGRTTIGERVWDTQRAIDVLDRHFGSQADCSKIICMGNSGGGTTTFFAACIEPRIAYVMPSSYFCSFDDCIAAMRHCACNFVPSIRNYFDMGDLAGLIAPRPLVIVCGKDDPIFPLHGVQKAFTLAQSQFVAAGAADNIRLVIGDGGHRFYADDAWPIMNMFIEQNGKTYGDDHCGRYRACGTDEAFFTD